MTRLAIAAVMVDLSFDELPELAAADKHGARSR
jgi:hypothetical protein